MDLLERSSLLDELAAALAATAEGGRVVLLAGEAGIGKSSVLQRFRDGQSAPSRWLPGTCDPLLTPRALGPIHDIARQTGGHLARSLAAGAPRAVVFDSFLEQLAAPSPGRLVVVLEDAHWADEATLDLLIFLGRRIEHARALLIVTYRDDELGADHPLRAVIAALPRDRVSRLSPKPLSEAAVAELARRSGRAATGLHALTGGNPLLVTEVLAGGDAGVPLTVRDLALARFGGLSEDAREVVRLVAVVPTRVELWLLEQARGPDPEAVERGVAAGLLVLDEEAVGFRHELLRRAVEGSLSPLTRRALHRQILAALAAPGGRSVDIARLAHHARQAEDVAAVLAYAPAAARQAAAVAAHREAVEHYRAALPHADQLSTMERAALLEEYSEEAYVSGFAQEALDARRAALRIRETEGADPERLGESLRWLSRLSWWAGRREDAEAAAARAIAVLEMAEPGHQLAMAYSNQAQLDMLAHRTEAALGWGARAIELADRLGDEEALTHALTNIGSARLARGDSSGRVELERAFDVAVGNGWADHAARALVNLASCDMEVRDYHHARRNLDRAVSFTMEHDLAGNAQYMVGMRARLRLDQGDWSGAESDARSALSELEQRRQGPRAVDALVVLGLLQARRGDPEATGTLDEAAARAQPTGELQWIGLVAAARAEHAWLRGDADRVAAEATEAFELAVRAGHPWFAGELAHWLWRADAWVDRPAQLAEPYRLLLAGDWLLAAAAWEALGCPYERALALALGDEEAIREALESLDALGARPAAQRLRRQLRQRGHSGVSRGPNRATAAHPAGLTGRQVEVLVLLVEGLTDAEIADRLSLSTKTVGHHVSALLAKLDVSSRHQAAAVARERGLGKSGGSGRQS